MIAGLVWCLVGLMLGLVVVDAAGNNWRRQESWRQLQSWWPPAAGVGAQPPLRPWEHWPEPLRAAQDAAWPLGAAARPVALRWRLQGAWRRNREWWPALAKGFFRWPDEHWLWHADVTLALFVSQPTRLSFGPGGVKVERWVLGWWPRPWSPSASWTELGVLIGLGLRTWCPAAWGQDPGTWTLEAPQVYRVVWQLAPTITWQVSCDTEGRWQRIKGPHWQLDLAEWSAYFGGEVPTRWELREVANGADRLVFKGWITDGVEGGPLRWW